MPLARTHMKFNYLILISFVGVGFCYQFRLDALLVLSLGMLVSTHILSPDLDVGATLKMRVIRLILYPYAIFFKHRGVSHTLFIGTITRVVYLFALYLFIVWLMNLSVTGTVALTLDYLLSLDLSLPRYFYPLSFLLGLLLGDISHILLDGLYSLLPKCLK